VEEFSEEELAKEARHPRRRWRGAGSTQMEGFGPSFAEELEELASRRIETPASWGSAPA